MNSSYIFLTDEDVLFQHFLIFKQCNSEKELSPTKILEEWFQNKDNWKYQWLIKPDELSSALVQPEWVLHYTPNCSLALLTSTYLFI